MEVINRFDPSVTKGRPFDEQVPMVKRDAREIAGFTIPEDSGPRAQPKQILSLAGGPDGPGPQFTSRPEGVQVIPDAPRWAPPDVDTSGPAQDLYFTATFDERVPYNDRTYYFSYKVDFHFNSMHPEEGDATVTILEKPHLLEAK
jgi:hypothetical protein